MREMSLDKAKIKLLLLEGVHPNAVEVLSQAGYRNVEALPGALEGDALKAKLADVHFLGIRSRTQLTAEVFAAAPKLVGVVFAKVREVRALGVTLLIVEQNARAALAISDRGYVLAQGREQVSGAAAELLANPEVGALYLGAKRGLT